MQIQVTFLKKFLQNYQIFYFSIKYQVTSNDFQPDVGILQRTIQALKEQLQQKVDRQNCP